LTRTNTYKQGQTGTKTYKQGQTQIKTDFHRHALHIIGGIQVNLPLQKEHNVLRAIIVTAFKPKNKTTMLNAIAFWDNSKLSTGLASNVIFIITMLNAIAFWGNSKS